MSYGIKLFDVSLNQQYATRRRKYLKSGNGKTYLKNRLRNYFQLEINLTGVNKLGYDLNMTVYQRTKTGRVR